MAFSSAGKSGPLAEINVTPLVDVMLVLLIIFIVTAPMLSRPIAVQLPQATGRVVDRPDPPPPIELRLDASSQLSWNGQPIAFHDLPARLRTQASAHAGHTRDAASAPPTTAEYDGLAGIRPATGPTGIAILALVRLTGRGRPGW